MKRWVREHGVFIAYVLINVLFLLVLLPLVGCVDAMTPPMRRLIVLSAKGDTLTVFDSPRCFISDGVVYGKGFQQQVPRDGTAVCKVLP